MVEKGVAWAADKSEIGAWRRWRWTCLVRSANKTRLSAQPKSASLPHYAVMADDGLTISL